MNLQQLTNEQIAEWLLNGKRGDLLELDAEHGPLKPTDRVIYKDKHMEIIYSVLHIAPGDSIEQFFFYSKWFGAIKNSRFTLEGWSGKTNVVRCGTIDVSQIKEFKSNTAHTINNKNQVAAIDGNDFAAFVAYCQRVHKASPSYQVIRVIAQAPEPWVKIEINAPCFDGPCFAEGASKREAANSWAAKFISEL